MKYCPTCETRYDEEVLRFCMKDGTPLLDEEEPNFIAMPSESLEDIEEDHPDDVTVIRRNIPVPPLPPEDFDAESFEPEQPPPPRIIVPTTPEPFSNQDRIRAIPPYQQRPPSNTAKVVLLTMIGTLFVLGIGAAGFWMLQKDSPDNSNINTNANYLIINTNANTNLGIDPNFNFNTGTNSNTATNVNTNTNANIKTPTPTPRPSPSSTPTASPTPDDDDDPTPTRTPFPTPTPIIIRPGGTPRSNPSPPARNTNSGVLNGQAVRLPTPSYPSIARQMRASGEVRVQVSVDDRGNVVSARAVSGHPLLRQAAESAARQSKIRPNGQNTSGELVYNFKNN